MFAQIRKEIVLSAEIKYVTEAHFKLTRTKITLSHNVAVAKCCVSLSCDTQ